VLAVKKLAVIATTQPHAAFATFTQCLQGQWTFLSRAMPDTSALFKPLEDTIRADFIRSLLKRDVNDLERDMLSLPARMGGLGIYKPIEECLISHTNSVCISAPLVRLIKRQEFDFDPRELADEMKTLSDSRFKVKLQQILKNAPPELKQPVELASPSYNTESKRRQALLCTKQYHDRTACP
jgi:hypothetical protein